ncbi:MAG: MgtC/SapB family protein, partial [Eubacterium sp.]|nr:MgtC/SapB family protein [Candidatus Colimonas fimequi]
MLTFTLPQIFYDVNIVSVTVRLLLALIIGGAIGLERGSHKHPAGFRTHILVCVGSALVMVTNQFCFDHFYMFTGNGDVVRMGAQVITGVGFLGAGTIMVAGRERIKGLTTAAGLWASACIGLACGIGFYSGAIVGALLIFLALTVLPRVEKFFYGRSRALNLYIEVNTVSSM